MLAVEALDPFGSTHAEVLHLPLSTLEALENYCRFAHHGHHFKLRHAEQRRAAIFRRAI